eukprot:8854146-Pyramimonas_sp.AAC.1
MEFPRQTETVRPGMKSSSRSPAVSSSSAYRALSSARHFDSARNLIALSIIPTSTNSKDTKMPQLR